MKIPHRIANVIMEQVKNPSSNHSHNTHHQNQHHKQNNNLPPKTTNSHPGILN